MSLSDKAWDALTTVIKMNDRVVLLAGTVKEQQQKIESLTERVIRLEATIEVLMRAAETKRIK